MQVCEAKWLRELEAENAKLTKLLAEAHVDVEDAPGAYELLAARLWACGACRATLRHVVVEHPITVLLRTRIIELAHARRRFGYRRIHDLRRRKGVRANHKRVFRLCRVAEFSVRKRQRWKGLMLDRQALYVPTAANEIWSIDFAMDALVNGSRIKCLTIVGDFARECLKIAVDYGISRCYVTRVLEAVSQFRGLPRAIRTDQEPEFTGRALDRWAYGSASI